MSHYVSAFDQAIRDPSNMTENGVRSGQISLEFYNKKKVNWPFAAECLPWEVWTIRIEIKTIRSEIGIDELIEMFVLMLKAFRSQANAN